MNEDMNVRYDQAEELFEQQNYEAALAIYRELAAQGHMMATYSIGWCYKQGVGLEKNYATAIEYYEAAYALGHGESAKDIGYCYAEGGFGIEQNNEKVIEWFEKAAEKGLYELYYQIGDRYTELNNMPMAKMAFEKGVEHGIPDCYAALSQCLAYEGKSENMGKILEYAKKSYDMGSILGASVWFSCLQAAVEDGGGSKTYLEMFDAAQKVYEGCNISDYLEKLANLACQDDCDIEVILELSKRYLAGVKEKKFYQESALCCEYLLNKKDTFIGTSFETEFWLHYFELLLDENSPLYNVSFVIKAIECMKTHTPEIKAVLEKCHRIQRPIYIKQGKCSYCGGQFKGLFKKTCTKCAKVKNY